MVGMKNRIKRVLWAAWHFNDWVALSSQGLRQLAWFNKSDVLRTGKRQIPWLTFGAIQYLDQTISPEMTILELGGGSSSGFWLERGNIVTTVETNPTWASAISDYVVKAGYQDRHRLNKIFDQTQQFDVIVNDGKETEHP
jgi:hypothetical protein